MDNFSCRICLNKIETLFSVYIAQNEKTIAEMLEFCIGIQILPNDNLSQYICKVCLDKLKTSNDLKTECLKNDLYLRNILYQKSKTGVFEEVTVKCEPSENDSSVLPETSQIDNSVKRRSNSKSHDQSRPNSNFNDNFDSSSAAKNSNFICYICDTQFTTKSEKTDHISNIHENEPTHNCSICDFLSSSGKYLEIHMKSHKVRKEHLCEFCSRCFFELQHLREHVTLVHQKPENNHPHTCSECPKKFKYVQNLRRHLDIHSEKKKFLCDICNSGYSRKESLEIHMVKAHNKESKIKCKDCLNAFPNMSKLRRHQEKYRGECVDKFRPRTTEKNVRYHCPYCSRDYKDKTHYQSHVYSHEGMRPFSCTKCKKGFFSKTNLNSHRVICENLRQFRCDYPACDKRFNKKETLEVHIRNTHTFDKPFECDQCQKRFASRKMYTKHVRNIHKIRQRQVKVEN